jgi:hypothetical protein
MRPGKADLTTFGGSPASLEATLAIHHYVKKSEGEASGTYELFTTFLEGRFDWAISIAAG